MKEATFLDDMCRLCLLDKEQKAVKMLFKITESIETKFLDVTNEEVLLINIFVV